MKKIFLLMGVLSIISCKKYKEIIIKDASKDTLVEIESTSDTPATLIFKVDGTVDDTCKIMGVPITKNNLGQDISVDAYNKKTAIGLQSI